ncbi:uncharacterized protein LOC132723817 [Ruditapes philippinarum]|uniref:uncharacterized protein LOC132723817 n=1 Tax=Ruditapes philippinarum TaxID=129788 RepID=UPI00295BF5D4|nr:uncharacterized protein LOC132723817 [Ruditapes philippinarum]
MYKNDEAELCTEFLELFCDPCKSDGQSLSVEGYCVDCEEYLCKDCYKVHCRPSITRHHVLKGKDNMPEKKDSKPVTCTIHPGKLIEFYCETHDEVCCSSCQGSSHEKCESVQHINDILPEIDIKKEFEKLHDNTELLMDDINITQYAIQSSLKAISINHDKASNEMSSVRQRVMENIDQIESELDKKLKKFRDDDERKIMSHRNACEAMCFDASTIESYVQPKISRNRTMDAFISMKRAQSKIRVDHVNLEKIRMDNIIKRYSFTPDKEMTTHTSHRYPFGKVSLNEKKSKTINFIRDLNAMSTDDSKICEVTGLCIISESLLAIVDKGNKKVKIIDINNDKITSIFLLSSAPYDITVISDDKLAVTLPAEKKIQFLVLALPEADAVTPENSLTVSGACHGINFIRNERKLIVTYQNSGTIEILDLDGTVAQNVDLNYRNVNKISVIPNTTLAYISKEANQSSACLAILEFKNKLENVCEISRNALMNAYLYLNVQGITTDKTGTAYICDDHAVYVTCNVEICNNTLNSTDVKIEMLEGYDTPRNARCIGFCDRMFRLYIGTKGVKIKVYTIA